MVKIGTILQGMSAFLTSDHTAAVPTPGAGAGSCSGGPGSNTTRIRAGESGSCAMPDTNTTLCVEGHNAELKGFMGVAVFYKWVCDCTACALQFHPFKGQDMPTRGLPRPVALPRRRLIAACPPLWCCTVIQGRIAAGDGGGKSVPVAHQPFGQRRPRPFGTALA